MAKPKPIIILRADVVRPKSVPPAFASTFGRLVNQILPKLGIHIGVEYFATGWVLFFGHYSDFRGFFGRPMFSKSREAPTAGKDADDGPFIWDFKFERLPPHLPEESLAQILNRFYALPGSLGAGTFKEISPADSGNRYRISYPSLAAYQAALEGLVQQAHSVFSAPRSDVSTHHAPH